MSHDPAKYYRDLMRSTRKESDIGRMLRETVGPIEPDPVKKFADEAAEEERQRMASQPTGTGAPGGTRPDVMPADERTMEVVMEEIKLAARKRFRGADTSPAGKWR